jgi:hypothetical protein
MGLSLAVLPVYPETLARTKHGDKFLDLGCCLGQEIRQLVFDGTTSENTFGSDLQGDFFPLGYELFQDQDRLKTTFTAVDTFDDASELTKLDWKMNIVYAGALFHLFGLEEQKEVAHIIVKLLLEKRGSMVVGQQSGNESLGGYGRKGATNGRTSVGHNPQTWKKLWEHVGELTASKWELDADLETPESILLEHGDGKEPKKGPLALRFVVSRV